MTGGFLINDTTEIRKILDSIPKDKQYEFIKYFKMDPFAKFYLEVDERYTKNEFSKKEEKK